MTSPGRKVRNYLITFTMIGLGLHAVLTTVITTDVASDMTASKVMINSIPYILVEGDHSTGFTYLDVLRESNDGNVIRFDRAVALYPTFFQNGIYSDAPYLIDMSHRMPGMYVIQARIDGRYQTILTYDNVQPQKG